MIAHSDGIVIMIALKNIFLHNYAIPIKSQDNINLIKNMQMNLKDGK